MMSTKDEKACCCLPSKSVFTFFLCQRTRQFISLSFSVICILLSTITTPANAAESTSSSSFLVDDFNRNDWYKRYPYYPPYCSIPSEMQQRKIPPLSAATIEQAGGSRLLHATVVIRHGARTPADAGMQCWQGYDEDPAFIWNCSLTSIMSVPSPHDIAQQEENSTLAAGAAGGAAAADDGIDVSALTATTSVALFRKQYDSLLNNPVGDTTLHNELKGSCEVGQLILRGYHQALQNGQFLRDAYVYNSAVEQGGTNDETLKLIDVATATSVNPSDGTLLPWDPRNLFLRSDDEQRTLMSGQVLIRGMLGPEIETYTDNNHQYPILALHTADYDRDYLDPNYNICPRLEEIWERFQRTSTFRSFNESQESNTLREFQRNVLGLQEDVSYEIIDCLMTTICTDRPLPDAINDYKGEHPANSTTSSGTAPQEQQQQQQQPSSSVSSETTNQSSVSAAENNSEGSPTNDTGVGDGRSLFVNKISFRRIQQESGEDENVAAALDNGNFDFLNDDGVGDSEGYDSSSSTASSSTTGSSTHAATSATTATTTSSSTAASQNEQQEESTGNKTTATTNQANSHGTSSSSSINPQSASVGSFKEGPYGTNMFKRLADFGAKMGTIVYTDNDSEFAKLATAPLWAEILPNLIAKRPGSGDIGSCCPPRPVSKMAVFSGHDTTIMPLLASLGPKVFDGTFAPYASMIVIEMHQVNLDATANKQLFRTERAFRLIYNGEVITSRMEGCSDEVDLCDAEILFTRLDSFATHARNCSRQHAVVEEYPDTVQQAEAFFFSTPNGIMTLIALVTGSAFLGAMGTYFVMGNNSSGIGAVRPMRRPKRRGKSRVAQDDPADGIFSADGFRDGMGDAKSNGATSSQNRNGFHDTESDDDDDDSRENGQDAESDDDELI